MTRMQISEVDALEILDAGRFSARNVNVLDEQSLPAAFAARSVVLLLTMAKAGH